jgi:hypothetical protein
MSTCKELTAAIAAENGESAKAKLEDQLRAREKSVRDGLKSKEKSLRAKENASLKELVVLLKECEDELPESDSILKRLRASVFSKESHIQETYEAKLTKKNLTCRALEEIRKACESELGGYSSPPAKDMLNRIQSTLEMRRESHRFPFEQEVAGCKSLTLKALSKLHQRLVLELDDTDQLVIKVVDAEKNRESTVKAQLTTRFKEMIKDIKKIKSSAVHDFLSECSEELDENDPLLSQVKSTLENKLLEGKGLKVVHNIDDLERGEREKVTDDLPASRGKKTKAEAPPKKKSSSKSAARSGSMVGSVASGALEIVTGFKNDLTGSPPASTTYKLGLIVVFVMYLLIVCYTTSLMFKVTHYEVDLTSLTAGIPPLPNFKHAAAPASAPKTGNNAKKTAAAPPTPDATPAAQAAEPEEASSGGGGGGDDEDD